MAEPTPPPTRALTRADFHAARRRTTTIDLPELGGTVTVVEPDAILRYRMQVALAMPALAQRIPGPPEARAAFDTLYVEVAIACCRTPDGAPLFVPDDAEWLKGTSGRAIERIYDAVRVLAEFGPEAVEAAAANFPETPSGASSSSWPNASGNSSGS